MESADELTLDCTELQSLLKSASRSHVRQLLASEITLLESKIHKLQEECKSKEASGQQAKEGKNEAKQNVSHVYTKKIQSYGWDQTDSAVKVYVPLEGIDGLPKESVQLDTQSKSLDLLVCNLDGKNHNLRINKLLKEIDPAKSFFKIKSGNVIVTLKKQVQQKWAELTSTDQTIKEEKAPKIEKDEEDPSAGIMKMMKQMYDDGDDEMKRTISKAWSESKDKQGGGMGAFNM